jgi:hypothetical protein
MGGISQKYKTGDNSKGVANKLYPDKKYTKNYLKHKEQLDYL